MNFPTFFHNCRQNSTEMFRTFSKLVRHPAGFILQPFPQNMTHHKQLVLMLVKFYALYLKFWFHFRFRLLGEKFGTWSIATLSNRFSKKYSTPTIAFGDITLQSQESNVFAEVISHIVIGNENIVKWQNESVKKKEKHNKLLKNFLSHTSHKWNLKA